MSGCSCLRMQAVAVMRAAKHCSANEALQGWCVALAGMSGDAAACGCRPLPCKQPAANADCCRATSSEALQRKRSPLGLECIACCAERDAAYCEGRLAAARATGSGCGLLLCKQPAADADCCRDRDREGKAAQTEPFKAECSAVMLSGCS